MVMAHNPNPHESVSYVIEKMIRESVKIVPPQAARVKMEKPGVLANSCNADLKLSEKIVTKGVRHLVILRESLIQVILNLPVKSNVHRDATRKQVPRM
jgi:hypothetical protein